jgi:hypothetical protein
MLAKDETEIFSASAVGLIETGGRLKKVMMAI